MAMKARSFGSVCLMAALLASSCGLQAAVSSVPGANGAAQDADAEPVDWRLLTGWKYVDGLQGMPDAVKQLSGRTVKITGHIVPIAGLEVLLVESSATLATCDGEINQVVHVTLTDPPTNELLRGKVQVTGPFKVGPNYLSGYCVDVYRIQAHGVRVME
jgi:hypothetical protein